MPYRLVSMFFSEGFGLLKFYGLMLEQFVQSDTLALHWSIQPGVSDGCLEMFSTREAAQDHIEVVRRHWLGVEGPLLAMVQLQIRTDRLYGFIQRGIMAVEGGKLKIFETLVSGTELYSLAVTVDGSVPGIARYYTESSSPLPVMSRAGDWKLYGGFLKPCVDCLDWDNKGLHWSMQPGAYGRITLYADPTQTTAKYAHYQKLSSGAGPEIVQVVLTMSEQAAARIMSAGALVKARCHGTFYMYVNMHEFAYFDQQHVELAYTVTVYTV